MAPGLFPARSTPVPAPPDEASLLARRRLGAGAGSCGAGRAKSVVSEAGRTNAESAGRGEKRHVHRGSSLLATELLHKSMRCAFMAAAAAGHRHGPVLWVQCMLFRLLTDPWGAPAYCSPRCTGVLVSVHCCWWKQSPHGESWGKHSPLL